MDNLKNLEEFNSFQKIIKEMKGQIGIFIVGQEDFVEKILIALLTRGHLLVEGVPGLAKTYTINVLADCLGCSFARIQFTPDLLPADIVGTRIYEQKDQVFSIRKGPVFANLVLADEINRAPAKVQSALLEAMQEGQVTIGGECLELPKPFLVMATQNPIDQEGTYQLAEAQMDRFQMKVLLDYPSREEERTILKKIARMDKTYAPKKVIDLQDFAQYSSLVDQVFMDDRLEEYLLDIVFATRSREQDISSFNKRSIAKFEHLLEFGASPRATIQMVFAAKARAILHDRDHVIPEDIRELAKPILRHRIRTSYEADAESINTDAIIDLILKETPLP
ncbi:MAG: MoxR family ATPase [Lentisphaeria bacterium]|nr:MoxR family ATPase [Lentisphaeria bacterium]